MNTVQSQEAAPYLLRAAVSYIRFYHNSAGVSKVTPTPTAPGPV